MVKIVAREHHDSLTIRTANFDICANATNFPPIGGLSCGFYTARMRLFHLNKLSDFNFHTAIVTDLTTADKVYL
jgi:hypothetical protein